MIKPKDRPLKPSVFLPDSNTWKQRIREKEKPLVMFSCNNTTKLQTNNPSYELLQRMLLMEIEEVGTAHGACNKEGILPQEEGEDVGPPSSTTIISLTTNN